MKNMNLQNDGLFGRIAKDIGDRLEKAAVSPRGCWNILAYESELSDEIIQEMVDSK